MKYKELAKIIIMPRLEIIINFNIKKINNQYFKYLLKFYKKQ